MASYTEPHSIYTIPPPYEEVVQQRVVSTMLHFTCTIVTKQERNEECRPLLLNERWREWRAYSAPSDVLFNIFLEGLEKRFGSISSIRYKDPYRLCSWVILEDEVGWLELKRKICDGTCREFPLYIYPYETPRWCVIFLTFFLMCCIMGMVFRVGGIPVDS
ncbi:hypothetical protein BC938DRAFT_482714 [Jimgerdemannia flammicorona]|uniref:Uncharacterized protein n=1 Tax=Jimgerdemannia flammicorona TaxID=994334 RepID=A0A433QDD7_9FUNG|nr:hypothetical protein BC938DRAFT_482714 [Jimgerdemannia flammicorona]